VAVSFQHLHALASGLTHPRPATPFGPPPETVRAARGPQTEVTVFSQIRDRLVAFFTNLFIGAFNDAANRAESIIGEHLATGTMPGGGQAGLKVTMPNPVALPAPSPPATPTVYVAPVAALQPPQAITEPAPSSTGEIAPRRPRGRPRKEPPKC
jgi:hypothetical protein